MSVRRVPSTEQLLRASSDDEQTMALPVPDSAFGFHAQQAVEKLYKALLASRVGSYPFSHDLLSLRKRVEACGIRLQPCAFVLEELSEYAGEARYAEPIPFTEDERALLIECVAALRMFVMKEAEMKL